MAMLWFSSLTLPLCWEIIVSFITMSTSYVVQTNAPTCKLIFQGRCGQAAIYAITRVSRFVGKLLIFGALLFFYTSSLKEQRLHRLLVDQEQQKRLQMWLPSWHLTRRLLSRVLLFLLMVANMQCAQDSILTYKNHDWIVFFLNVKISLSNIWRRIYCFVTDTHFHVHAWTFCTFFSIQNNSASFVCLYIFNNFNLLKNT